MTNEAIGVVEAHDGIVESSQTSGTDESARATLQLAIPTRNLDAALDELSDLADVKLAQRGHGRHHPPVRRRQGPARRPATRSAAASWRRSSGRHRGSELDALKLRLAAVERAIAQAEAEFRNLQRRATLSSVTLQITSEGARRGRLVASRTRSTTPAAS